MSVQNISWLEKYRPTKLSDYYISSENFTIIKNWIEDYKNGSEDAKPFLILYGTAGIGKTTLAHLIFNHYNYEVIESNASDTRTKKYLQETIGQISKYTVCLDFGETFKPVAIVMDEIDGLAGGESNAVQELIDIITKDKDSKKNVSICPVICTCNSIKDKKLAPLIKMSVMLDIGKPDKLSCEKLIKRICKSENFSISTESADKIIEMSYGDYRQLIMMLFDYYYSLKNENKTNNKTDTNKTNNNKTNTSGSTNDENLLQILKSKYLDDNITMYADESEHYSILKKISHTCETPLEKINYFLTNDIDIEDIRYICSDDSNLYFMNFYINVIPIIATIQSKVNIKTKASFCDYYKCLSLAYKHLAIADMMNDTIFLNKNFDLLDLFGLVGLAMPIKLLNSKNKANSKNKLIINLNNTNTNKNKLINKTNDSNKKNNTNESNVIDKFQITHHTQYNFMRQEQFAIKKKINSDYLKIMETNVFNIYYKLKLFQKKNEDEIRGTETKFKNKKKNLTNEQNKYCIDKTYLKMMDKINELLK